MIPAESRNATDVRKRSLDHRASSYQAAFVFQSNSVAHDLESSGQSGGAGVCRLDLRKFGLLEAQHMRWEIQLLRGFADRTKRSIRFGDVPRHHRLACRFHLGLLHFSRRSARDFWRALARAG